MGGGGVKPKDFHLTNGSYWIRETLKGLCITKCKKFLQVKIRLWTTQIKGCRRTDLEVCQASQESINR